MLTDQMKQDIEKGAEAAARAGVALPHGVLGKLMAMMWAYDGDMKMYDEAQTHRVEALLVDRVQELGLGVQDGHSQEVQLSGAMGVAESVIMQAVDHIWLLQQQLIWQLQRQQIDLRCLSRREGGDR